MMADPQPYTDVIATNVIATLPARPRITPPAAASGRSVAPGSGSVASTTTCTSA